MTEEISGIKSKPVYNILQYDPKSRSNLLISEGNGLEGLADLLNRSKSIQPSTINVMCTISSAEPLNPNSYISPDRCNKMRSFDSVNALLEDLPVTLSKSQMGLRLYICGSEIFLWSVANIARAAGMHKSEYSMQLIGSKARRVYCPHCKTTSEGVTTDIHECVGCGLSLVNCDHFSREMGAYLGFRVDAEVHGEIPERQELYR
jgi:hypothetical protein